MGIIYATTNLLLRSVLRIFGDWKVSGRDNVPRKGALIIVANHISDIDALILNASIPRRVEFMAKAELFQNPIISHLSRAYGAFPINENGMEFYSINHSLAILKRNGALGIFPEGAKNPTALGEAMLGSTIIAMKSGASILPVGIIGTESVGNGLRMCCPRGTFRINIGKPFSVPDARENRLRANIESATVTIMNQIAALLPERYRGVYHNDWKGERSYTSPPKWSDARMNMLDRPS